MKSCSCLGCMKPADEKRTDGCCSDDCAKERAIQIEDLTLASAIAQTCGDLFQSPVEPEIREKVLAENGF